MKPERNRRDLRAKAAESEQGWWERNHAEWLESARHWRQHAAKYHGGYGWWRNAIEQARYVRQFCKHLPA